MCAFCLVTLTIWHNLPVIFSSLFRRKQKKEKKESICLSGIAFDTDWSVSFGSHEIPINNEHKIKTPYIFSAHSFCVLYRFALESIHFAASIFQRHDSVEINLQQLTRIYILNPWKNAYQSSTFMVLIWVCGVFTLFRSCSHSHTKNSHATFSFVWFHCFVLDLHFFFFNV